jgi:NADP-dependent aldehyde dehydrogenase
VGDDCRARLGAGQFCTNPGIAVAIRGKAVDAFAEAAAAALSETGPQVMLTDGIAEAYRAGRDRVAGATGVQELRPRSATCATPRLTFT